MTLSQVKRTEYPAAACRKVTQYCAVFTDSVLIMRLAMGGWCMLEDGMGIIHSPFFVCGPLATIWLLWRIFTSSLLNVAKHPESHNCLIDKRDPFLRDGNRCMWCTARGRSLIVLMPVCVDVM